MDSGVYVPLAHWIFAFDGFSGAHGGWLANRVGVLHFAGGNRFCVIDTSGR